jgi:hypothetical protein
MIQRKGPVSAFIPDFVSLLFLAINIPLAIVLAV